MNSEVDVEGFLSGFSSSKQNSFQEVYVNPGDVLNNYITIPVDGKVTLLKGIYGSQNAQGQIEKIQSSTSGILKHRAPATYWVESKTKFYSPIIGHQVRRYLRVLDCVL